MIDAIQAASTSEDDHAQRRALMFATLGFNELVRVPPGMEASFRALRSWLNSCRGIGDIETGMRRQGYDLYLCRYGGRGWRATFYLRLLPPDLARTVVAPTGFEPVFQP